MFRVCLYEIVGFFSNANPEFIVFNALVLSRITDIASRERGFSRSEADKIIESVADELLAGSRRFDYERSYAMLLGALRLYREYLFRGFPAAFLRFPCCRHLDDDHSLR